jgi:DNA-binding cell septation regulator SpoVG
MATRRNNTTSTRSEDVPVQYKILRVHRHKSTTFFDIEINGVSIYGCTIVDGRQGSFIGWPSRKSEEGKYYKYAYVPLTEDDLQGIIDAVDTFKE